MASKPVELGWQSGNALASGCIRYWAINSSLTTVTDYSPSAKNLTVTGTPTLVTAPNGSGNEYSLNGSAWASGADTGLPSGAAAWSIAAWILSTRVMPVNSDQTIVFWGSTGAVNGARVVYSQSNWTGAGYPADTQTLSAYGSVQTGSTAINNGVWHRIVAVYNGSAVQFYRDGVADGSAQAVALSIALNGSVFLGSTNGGTPWIGSLGDVAVWNRALSASEVTSDFSDPWQQVRPPALAASAIVANGTPGVTTIPLSTTSATGGVAPYTYQWQRSPRGAATWSNISGATALTLNDSGLSAGTSYDYQVRVTDAGSLTATSAIFQTATLWAVDNPNVHLSPISWYVLGSNPATNAVTVRDGSMLSFGFTGTSAVLVMDVTNVADPTKINLEWSIDYGVLQASHPAASLSLASGLAAGTHAAIFADVFQDSGFNRWLVNGTYPDYCVNIKGIRLDPGAALAAAPVVLSDKTLLTGDSITCGVSSGPSGAYDSFYSWGQIAANALGSEPCFDAFSSSGFTVTTPGSNVPPLNSRIGYHWNGQARSLTGLKRVIIYLGQNDGDGSFGSTVATCLSTFRSAVGASVPIYLIVQLRGTGRASVTSGFASYAGTVTQTTLQGTAFYQKGPNDANAYLIDLGADWSPGYTASVGTDTIYTLGGVHYSTLGANRAGRVIAWAVQRVEAASAASSSSGRSRGRLQGG